MDCSACLSCFKGLCFHEHVYSLRFFALKTRRLGFDSSVTWLPAVGEAAPQALAVTPEQPVEDAVKKAVQVETVHVGLPPDPLQRRAHVGSHDIQHLAKGGRKSLNRTPNDDGDVW